MLSIDSTVTGDVCEIKLKGRLDVKAAKDAEAAFAEAVTSAKSIVLDMSELDYIASAGLRTLKRLSASIRENGGTLVLRNVQDTVMEIFEITGFAALLTFE